MDAGPMYTLARGEQRHRPYTRHQLREYSAAGSVQPTDLVWTPGMETWSRVSDILKESGADVAPPPIPVAEPRPTDSAPKPFSLHWAIVLLLALVTWGLFALFWMFVQAVWVRRIDPKSKALYLLTGGTASAMILGFISGITGAEGIGLDLLVRLVWIVAVLVAYFDMRAAIEVRFGVELSGIMTFFFNVLYLQYHLRLIARGQHTSGSGRMVT